MDVELRIKETGEIQSQRVYMGDFPIMTDQGTFIINGAERVVVSQLVRSPGVYYTADRGPGHRPQRCTAPRSSRTAARGSSSRPAPATSCTSRSTASASSRPPSCCAPSAGRSNERDGRRSSARVDTGEIAVHRLDAREGQHQHAREALIEVYKKLRPGDPPTGDNAEKLVESLFFNFRRYDLGRVGRYKLNKKLDPVAERMGISLPRDQRTITQGRHRRHRRPPDRAQQRPSAWPDDIDHLGNRRIRANGELIQNAFRVGLLRMERVVSERMTIQEIDKATPNALINIRPVVAAMKEFFGGSQLSQFMDQTNPLAELTSQAPPRRRWARAA